MTISFTTEQKIDLLKKWGYCVEKAFLEIHNGTVRIQTLGVFHDITKYNKQRRVEFCKPLDAIDKNSWVDAAFEHVFTERLFNMLWDWDDVLDVKYKVEGGDL